MQPQREPQLSNPDKLPRFFELCADFVPRLTQESESMRIASAASAFPKHYYSQKVLLDRLQDYWGDQLKNPLLLARLHRNVTVDGRYLAIPA